ncbi:MAG: HAD family hydrolase [Gammaproteobacteria bacterium]|nr:HAD family hydrolase [Gammaproteobacteria bacterium]
MHHVMFDIDGTLVESYEFDADCFTSAVQEVLGINIDEEWSNYKHVTDAGILNEVIELNSLNLQKDEIFDNIKKIFFRKITAYIQQNPVKEIPGASSFISKLIDMDNIVVSFATGGWYESAMLKLISAGFDINNIPIGSSDDHFRRTKIMKIAEARVNNGNIINPVTYFGDGVWDKAACKELGYNFVLVGDKFEHTKNINNFNSADEAFVHIGL